MSDKKKKNKKHKVDEKKCDCGTICGNLQLNNQVPTLDIWEVWHEKDATVFLSIYNSVNSTSTINVLAIRKDQTSLEFTVPPGNTSSGTVDHADIIRVSRVGQGNIEGRYCLDVCLTSS
ncbi:S-Ena type endospore appendage [Ferdinandcohnia sp. Marseille-Q9671]